MSSAESKGFGTKLIGRTNRLLNSIRCDPIKKDIYQSSTNQKDKHAKMSQLSISSNNERKSTNSESKSKSNRVSDDRTSKSSLQSNSQYFHPPNNNNNKSRRNINTGKGKTYSQTNSEPQYRMTASHDNPVSNLNSYSSSNVSHIAPPQEHYLPTRGTHTNASMYSPQYPPQHVANPQFIYPDNPIPNVENSHDPMQQYPAGMYPTHAMPGYNYGMPPPTMQLPSGYHPYYDQQYIIYQQQAMAAYYANINQSQPVSASLSSYYYPSNHYPQTQNPFIPSQIDTGISAMKITGNSSHEIKDQNNVTSERVQINDSVSSSTISHSSSENITSQSMEVAPRSSYTVHSEEACNGKEESSNMKTSTSFTSDIASNNMDSTRISMEVDASNANSLSSRPPRTSATFSYDYFAQDGTESGNDRDSIVGVNVMSHLSNDEKLLAEVSVSKSSLFGKGRRFSAPMTYPSTRSSRYQNKNTTSISQKNNTVNTVFFDRNNSNRSNNITEHGVTENNVSVDDVQTLGQNDQNNRINRRDSKISDSDAIRSRRKSRKSRVSVKLISTTSTKDCGNEENGENNIHGSDMTLKYTKNTPKKKRKLLKAVLYRLLPSRDKFTKAPELFDVDKDRDSLGNTRSSTSKSTVI
jgi:hypothetical protein